MICLKYILIIVSYILPCFQATKKSVVIGYLHAIGSESWQIESFTQFRQAIKDVNADPNILPNINLNYTLGGARYATPIVSLNYTDKWCIHRAQRCPIEENKSEEDSFGDVVAIIGPSYSNAAGGTAMLSSVRKVPIISPASTSSNLHDKSKFPLFVRTVPGTDAEVITVAQFMKKNGWKSMTFIYPQGSSSFVLGLTIPQLFKSLDIDVVHQAGYSTEGNDLAHQIDSTLMKVKESGSKVIVVDSRTEDTMLLWKSAVKAELFISGYVWICMRNTWDYEAWKTFPKDQLAGLIFIRPQLPELSKQELEIWRNNTILLNKTDTLEHIYDQRAPMYRTSNYPNPWGLYVYDTVFMLARALHIHFNELNELSSFHDFEERYLNQGEALVKQFLTMSYPIMKTGSVFFNHLSQDRKQVLEIVNIQQNDTLKVIAVSHADSDDEFNKNSINNTLETLNDIQWIGGAVNPCDGNCVDPEMCEIQGDGITAPKLRQQMNFTLKMLNSFSHIMTDYNLDMFSGYIIPNPNIRQSSSELEKQQQFGPRSRINRFLSTTKNWFLLLFNIQITKEENHLITSNFSYSLKGTNVTSSSSTSSSTFSSNSSSLSSSILRSSRKLKTFIQHSVKFERLGDLILVLYTVQSNFPGGYKLFLFYNNLPLADTPKNLDFVSPTCPQGQTLLQDNGMESCVPEKNLSDLWIIIVVAIFLFLSVIYFLLFLFVRRKERKKTLEQASFLRSRQSLLESAKINSSEITIKRELGRGNGGIVYLGEYRGASVALKKLSNIETETVAEIFNDVMNEATAMSSLRHPNILMFMGCCLDADHGCIISEFCAQGSLYDVIHTYKDISWVLLLKLLVGAARGLLYLHRAAPPLVHRDIKSFNVLVDDNWMAKLADFGTLRVLKEAVSKKKKKTNKKYDLSSSSFINNNNNIDFDDDLSSDVGTVRWSAPEMLLGRVLEQRGHRIEIVKGLCYTEAVDIYSFGMMCWEVSSKEVPYAEMKFLYQVEQAVLAGQRPPLVPNSQCPKGFNSLIESCWDDDPKKRPSADHLLKKLEQMFAQESSKRCSSEKGYFPFSSSSFDRQLTRTTLSPISESKEARVAYYPM